MLKTPPPSLDNPSFTSSLHSGSSPHFAMHQNPSWISSNNPLLKKTPASKRSMNKNKDDTVYETSKIRNAFAPTFVSLREALPRTIAPGAICDFKEKRQKKAAEKFEGKPYKSNKYSYPEYMSSDYDVKMKLNKEERATMKALQLSDEPFRPGGYRRKLKHENLIDPRVERVKVKKMEKDGVAERAMNHIRKLATEGITHELTEVDVEKEMEKKKRGTIKKDSEGNLMGSKGGKLVRGEDGKVVEKVKRKKGFDLKEAFDHYDKDGSGSIDRNELMGVVKMIVGEEGFKELNDEEKEGIVNLFDPNGDGEIRFDEFSYSFYNRRGDHESSSYASSNVVSEKTEKYRYPYSSNPYDESREYWQKMKKIEDSKILEGPFKGGGLQKLKSDKINYLPEAVKLLFKTLKSDWEDCNFHASIIEGNKSRRGSSGGGGGGGASVQDQVIFKFQRNTLDSESALNNYMNVLSNTNKVVHRGRMKRVNDRWGVVECDEQDDLEWVYFTFFVMQD